MMVMDRPFTTASPVLANYDYTDILDGVGIKTYYIGSALDNSAATQYILTSNTFPPLLMSYL